jgi:hypothetical protein
MPKYEPITQYLSKRGQQRIPMSFQEVERLIGTPLPRSSRTYRAWWANNPTGHSVARAWADAGYRTEQVDMAAQRLVFVKEQNGGVPPTPGRAGASPATGRHPAWGALKGTSVVLPGVDLTEPADPDWGHTSGQ